MTEPKGTFERVERIFLGMLALATVVLSYRVVRESLTRASYVRRAAVHRSRGNGEQLAGADRPAAPADAGEAADERGWYGHQEGRLTGLGVAPGAGDSEAGTSAINS